MAAIRIPYRPTPRSYLTAGAVVAALVGTMVLAPSPMKAGEHDAGCRAAYYSPATVQHAGRTVYPQNVYAVPSSQFASGDPFPLSFVGSRMQIDAACAVSSDAVRFSTDRNGYISTDTGLVRVLHNQLYRATRTADGVVVELDAGWAELDLRLGSLDAVHHADGCFSFSVAATEPNPDGPGSLRPWEAYRACPDQSLELLLDAGSELGASNIDALHVDGSRVEFSTELDLYLPGGDRVWSQNTYGCTPTGSEATCAPSDLTDGFSGVAIGLNDLNAYSSGDGVICDDGNACTQFDHCREQSCVGEPVVCPEDQNECTIASCDSTTGTCSQSEVPDARSCDDGTFCTTDDRCQSGTCHGVPFPGCCESDVDCDTGDRCNTATCDIEMNACSLIPVDCNGYTCDQASGCRTSCTSNDHCDEGSFCEQSTCTPRRELGSQCVADNQCLSSNCPQDDGVCCDAPCDSTCEACLSSKTGSANGTCAPVQGGTDPDDECAFVCDGSGQCGF